MRQTTIYWALIGLAALLVAFMPLPASATNPKERVFRVEAGDFAYTPAVLNVNPGDRVTIELISTDVVHGLYVDNYDLSVTADPGQPATLSFIANKSGTFRLRCSVTCGALHPFMLGKLQVGRKILFWRGIGLSLLALLGVVFTRKLLSNSEN